MRPPDFPDAFRTGTARRNVDDILKDIHWLGHAGLLLEGSPTIYIDPFNLEGSLPKADLILITHPHYDHCSPRDISRILKDDTAVVGPEDALAKIPLEGIRCVPAAPHKPFHWNDVLISPLPAFSWNKPQHPASKNWLGFMLRWGGRWIYHAGDGNVIPRIPRRWLDAAFLPVDTGYSLIWSEGVVFAYELAAGVSVPVHFGSICGPRSEAERFVRSCVEERGLNARMPVRWRGAEEDLPMPEKSGELSLRGAGS